jgi:hypothetical protein
MLEATFKPRPSVAVHDFSRKKKARVGTCLLTAESTRAPHYGRKGILDVTHTRLFTFRSVRELLKQSGYQILETREIPTPFPGALGNTFIARALLWLNAASVHMSKGLFSYPDFHSGGSETDGEQFAARNDLGQRRIESRSAWPGGLMAEGSGQRRF